MKLTELIEKGGMQMDRASFIMNDIRSVLCDDVHGSDCPDVSISCNECAYKTFNELYLRVVGKEPQNVPEPVTTSAVVEVVTKDPLDVQVGGDHYKKYKIQPLEYAHANELDFFQGNIVKYITRFRDKGGVKDLEKIKHIVDVLIKLEYGEEI